MTTLRTPEPFRIPRKMYDQMVNAGLLEGQNVELIQGDIVTMSPINNPHVSACTLVTELLREVFGKSAHIRVQGALAIGESEPQPDVAVIAGAVRDYQDHPTTALLVVEVSDSSLRFDRGTKSSLYASGDIPEYWVVNLPAKRLEIFLNPSRDPSAEFGCSYEQSLILKPGEKVLPRKAPAGAKPFEVSEIFP